ncbi:Glu-tRNA(Gln) amidotransferase subunit GatE [archaeon]|nr:Glu-tRNA(Gln) amidotransferase subunit GatE [archaeon]
MLDYQKLGFKCGIEIHQQLSGKKLFCNCNTNLEEKEEQFTIARKIRPSAGELGKKDIAGLYEEARQRTFVYHAYENEACLVEADEEPPHEINKDALKAGLALAKFFKMDIPDVMCIMRKGVFDGSSVSSFQRTALIGIGAKSSFIQTSRGKVRIEQLNLEEDACKNIKIENQTAHYSLSRQGIPLLEIGTDPSLKEPEHALETAKYIGMVLRSFPLVKRGIGTIRQDVNISIKEGARIEVKGWQDLKTFRQLIENEVQRQLSLLEIKEELKKRKVKKADYKTQDVTSIFKNTNCRFIAEIINKDGVVLCLKLPKFASLLKRQICLGKTFGKELSEYAIPFGAKGMIHSDEDLKKYNLEGEFKSLKGLMKANQDDILIIISEQRDIAVRAMNAIAERAEYCLKGVPLETRTPNHENATTSYARPLPGSARMYPETDIPEIGITKEMLDKLSIPELIGERSIRIQKEYKLNPEQASLIAKSAFDFEYFAENLKNLEPSFIASVLTIYPKELKREGINIEVLTEEDYFELLSYANKGEVAKEALKDMLHDKAQGRKIEIQMYKPAESMEELEREIKNIAEENKSASINALMGIAMQKYRGKVDGKKVMEILKKLKGQQKSN